MVDFATLTLTADTAGLNQGGVAIDAIAAKATKAEAATRKMGTGAKAMGTAVQAAGTQAKAALDGIEAEARQAEAALAQATAGLTAMERGATAAGRSTNAAAGQVGNLTAQVFDISMMMQAGQNPFQLMLQQGSQVAQVMGPMGAAGAVAALKGVFVQLLNPVNLAVFAIIGGTAALVQWATAAASSEAETEAFTQAAERQKAVLDALKDATESLRLEREMMASGAQFAEEQQAMNEINQLMVERAILLEEINQKVETIGGKTAFYANQEAEDRRAVALARIAELDQALGVLQAERDATAAAEAHVSAIENAYAVYGKTRAEGEELAEAAERAGMSASALANITFGNIAQAVVYANNLADAMARASLNYGKIQNTGQSGPDAARRSVMALNAPGVPTGTLASGAGGVWKPPPGSGGGSGGGGGGRSEAATEAEKEAEAIQKVVDKLKSEIETIGMAEGARRLHQELQKAGVTIYSEEGQAIAALVEQLTELEAKQKLVSETMRGIENAAQGFFVGVLSGAKDLKSALGDVLKSLGDLFLNQAFKMLWGGQAAGGKGGGIGGWLAGLFDAGGHIPAGQVGVVAEKRPELVDGRLVTRPTLVPGPADVTGGAATAKMMGVPMPQTAGPTRQSQAMQPRVNVAAAPVRVVVLDDPRKIDAWSRSPEGERAAARQQRRLGNG